MERVEDDQPKPVDKLERAIQIRERIERERRIMERIKREAFLAQARK
jgi:hypothetical protein